MRTAALVLAAGSSRRLGQPKQLLAYRGRTLLDVSLDVARTAPVDQRLVTVGGAGQQVLDTVAFDGFDIVESVKHTEGCSSSIVSALDALGDDVDGFLLLLGDQPEMQQSTIETVLAHARSGKAIVVCEYDDGIGHPFWFGRATFGALTNLHGDKAVWKVIESDEFPVTTVRIPGEVPLDVDTWEDYEVLLAAEDRRAVEGDVATHHLEEA